MLHGRSAGFGADDATLRPSRRPMGPHQGSVIDAALVGAGDPPLREVEKLVAREHPARTLAKGVQEVEFGSRHGDSGARGTDQLAQRQMNFRTLPRSGRANPCNALQATMLAPIMAARIAAALRRVKLGADPLGPHTHRSSGRHPVHRSLAPAPLAAASAAVQLWLLLLKEEPQHLAAGIRPAWVGVGAGWASS